MMLFATRLVDTEDAGPGARSRDSRFVSILPARSRLEREVSMVRTKTRVESFHLRLSTRELLCLRAVAEASAMTASAWIRQQALGAAADGFSQSLPRLQAPPLRTPPANLTC